MCLMWAMDFERLRELFRELESHKRPFMIWCCNACDSLRAAVWRFPAQTGAGPSLGTRQLRPELGLRRLAGTAQHSQVCAKSENIQELL